MATKVTKENYARAMFDMAMQREISSGADNAWHHHRELMPLDAQPAPMMNRDTVYSFVIADARSDFRVVLPTTDGRYQSLHVVNDDHVTFEVRYGPGVYVIPADATSDHVVINVRTQIDANDPADRQRVNDFQDQLIFEHLDADYEPVPFSPGDWDMTSFGELHRRFVAVANETGIRGTMGTVDAPVTTDDRNRGVSIGTGLLPDRDAIYVTASYSVDTGTAHTARYRVPELRDSELGFYSITVYGDDQYLHSDRGSILSDREIELNPDGETFDVEYVTADRFDGRRNQLLIPTETFWINFRIYMPSDRTLASEFELPRPQPTT